MDLFYLLQKNFKNLLFDSLITRRSFESLSYLSSCPFSQRWRFRGIRSNLLWGIESDLAYTKISGVVSQYILQSNIWYPLSSGMLKWFDVITWPVLANFLFLFVLMKFTLNTCFAAAITFYESYDTWAKSLLFFLFSNFYYERLLQMFQVFGGNKWSHHCQNCMIFVCLP